MSTKKATFERPIGTKYATAEQLAQFRKEAKELNASLPKPARKRSPWGKNLVLTQHVLAIRGVSSSGLDRLRGKA